MFVLTFFLLTRITLLDSNKFELEQSSHRLWASDRCSVMSNSREDEESNDVSNSSSSSPDTLVNQTINKRIGYPQRAEVSSSSQSKIVQFDSESNRSESDLVNRVSTMTDPVLKLADLTTLMDKFNKFQVVKISVTKLSHTLSSYRKWSQDLGAELRYYKVWPIIRRRWDHTAKASPDWIDVNEIIMDNIRKNIDEYYEQMILKDTDAAVAWERLRAHFEGNELVRSIRTMRSLSQLMINKRDALEDTVVEFKNIASDLKELFGALPESLLIGAFVTVLPDSCGSAIKRIMGTDESKIADLKLDKVINDLMNEHQLNKEQGKEKMKSTLNAIHSNGKDQKRCHYCGLTGHAFAECRRLEQDEKNGSVRANIFIQGTKRGGSKRFGQSQSKPADSESKVKQEPKPAAGTSASKPNEPNGGKKMKIHSAAILSASSKVQLRRDKYHIDTGAGEQIANLLDGCIALENSTYRDPVYSANDSPMEVRGVGTYRLIGTGNNAIELTDVLYVPDAVSSFISYGCLDRKGYGISGRNGVLYIQAQNSDEVIITGRLVDENLYECDLKPYKVDIPRSIVCRISKSRPSEDSQNGEVIEWHSKLDHVGLQDLKKIEGKLEIVVQPSIPLNCLICKLAKMTRDQFLRIGIQTTQPLEVVHSDLSGIIRLPNFDGARYFLVFIDDYTRYQTVFILSRKYQVYCHVDQRPQTNCESEVLATLDGVSEAEFLVNLITELKMDAHLILPVTLHNDNKGANLTIQTGGRHRSNKQYRPAISVIRRAVSNRLVEMSHEIGVKMVADALTKALPFKRVHELLSIANFSIC